MSLPVNLNEKIAYDYLYSCAFDALKYANTLRSMIRREDTKNEINQYKRKMKKLLNEIDYILKNYE